MTIITWEELTEMFPDGVEFTMVPETVAVEIYHDPGQTEQSGLFIVREHKTQLQVIRDGLWAGMSEVTHTVFLYTTREDFL